MAEAITTLKRQPGRNINLSGSGTLVEFLLRQGLLDELHLLVYPVVVGHGTRLFADGGETVALKRAESTAFSNGVLHLAYTPVGD